VTTLSLRWRNSGQLLRLDGASFRIVTTLRGDARAPVEPFGVLELDLGLLWAR